MVSEIMLQQTQTDRVAKKYDEWLAHFPTTAALASAPLQKVLTHWQGLGYNRRALALKRAAEKIEAEYKGKFPKTYEEILELPGIGPYTAGAIMAFAYNKPVPIIETNIRTVYIHFFFKDHGGIHDKELLPLIEKTLDRENPRDWYYALMDYGVFLKKTIGNLGRKSLHYTRQSPFKGSNREIRSTILKIITQQSVKQDRLKELLKKSSIKATDSQVSKNIDAMVAEGFIELKKSKISIKN
jgi:A/G-specific adenine glycosylase